MSDYKKLRKSQFNAICNEVVRLARRFNDNGHNSSITFMGETLTLYVHDDNKCVCALTLRNERRVFVDDIKELVDISAKANIELNGRYIGLMVNAVLNRTDDDDEYYVGF